MKNAAGTHDRRVASVLLILLVAAATLAAQAGPPQSGQTQAGRCTPAGALVPLSGVSEASGLAVSKRVPGRLWTINDSGQPELAALDNRGAITAQVRVTGATVEDWEAIAVAPCDSGSCVYIADIGDNNGSRTRITVYRVPEPEGASRSAAVSDVFHATYPDGAHDAETLLVADGRLYIVTKGETGPVAIYRFPAQLQAGATMRLERVGQSRSKADAAGRITDGSVSPDGQWVVLRTKTSVAFHRTSDVLAGKLQAVSSADVTGLKEPQGEGIAVGADHAVFLAGEGGGKGQPGTFARVTCTPPR